MSLRSVKLITAFSSLMKAMRLNSRNCLPISSMHFWRGHKLPVIIAKELDVEEKFRTLVKSDRKSTSELSLEHFLTSQGRKTVVVNEEYSSIPTRLVTGWTSVHSTIMNLRKSILDCSKLGTFHLSLCALATARISPSGAVLGTLHEKNFRPIHYASKTWIEAQTNFTSTEKNIAIVYCFREIVEGFPPMNLTSKFIDTNGAEIPRSRFICPDWKTRMEKVNDPKEINESFPLETLNMTMGLRKLTKHPSGVPLTSLLYGKDAIFRIELR
ncbi:hypothetical protein Tco_1215235 [Tanacetum coccineum]